MSEEKKENIKEMVSLLEELDKESLLILSSGAQMLKARQDMDSDSNALPRKEGG